MKGIKHVILPVITDMNLLFHQRKTAQILGNMMLNFINEETS